MTNKLTVLFKMMILTMLDMVDFELSAAQMGEFMVGNDYMSFFRFQSLLYEMEQDELISCKREHHNSFYSLNENGRHTLEYFRDKLPEEMRAAVVLRDIQGYSYDEIATILNANVGTIKSRISRGREKLREKIAARPELFDRADV